MRQLEDRLSGFMTDNNVAAPEMFDICQTIYAIDPFSLTCLEFLVNDYETFVDMMLDFKRAFLWEEEENEG